MLYQPCWGVGCIAADLVEHVVLLVPPVLHRVALQARSCAMISE